MKETGNSPPATVPAKAMFLAQDVARNIQFFNLPEFKNVPANFFSDMYRSSVPVNRLLSIVCANADVPEEAKWRIVEAAFHIFWESQQYRSESSFIVKPMHCVEKDLKAHSGESLIIESAITLIETMGKTSLKSNTDRVVSLGGFGSPIFQFPESKDRDIFFGSDRFEQIAFMIGKTWYGPSPSIVHATSKL